MKTFEQIRQQLMDGEFDFSRHALKRAVERNISEEEIRQMAENAQIIEEYPEDKFSPSCLIFGQTKNQRPLHLQVSFADTENVRIVTLYEPDPAEWIDFIERR
jgi:hypothetical protein